MKCKLDWLNYGNKKTLLNTTTIVRLPRKEFPMGQTFMKEKKILPLVLSMSLPMMLSMLVNSLYNIVDSYFVAQISEQAMTALSLVYPLQLLETAIAVGFGIGMNAAAAYYLGAKEQQRADDIVTSGLILSLLHGSDFDGCGASFCTSICSLFTERKDSCRGCEIFKSCIYFCSSKCYCDNV